MTIESIIVISIMILIIFAIDCYVESSIGKVSKETRDFNKRRDDFIEKYGNINIITVFGINNDEAYICFANEFENGITVDVGEKTKGVIDAFKSGNYIERTNDIKNNNRSHINELREKGYNVFGSKSYRTYLDKKILEIDFRLRQQQVLLDISRAKGKHI